MLWDIVQNVQEEERQCLQRYSIVFALKNFWGAFILHLDALCEEEVWQIWGKSVESSVAEGSYTHIMISTVKQA